MSDTAATSAEQPADFDAFFAKPEFDIYTKADQQELNPEAKKAEAEVTVTSEAKTPEAEATNPTENANPEVEAEEELTAEDKAQLEQDAPRRLYLGKEIKPEDRAFLKSVTSIARTKGISIQEAVAELTGRQETAPQKQEDPGDPDPNSIEGMESELTALRAKIDQGIEENVGLYSPELKKLEREERALEAKILNARASQQRQAQSFEQQFQSELEAVEKQYPDAAKPGTALYEAIADANSAIQASDPRYRHIDISNPQWGKQLVEMLAKRLNINPLSGGSQAPAIVKPAASKPDLTIARGDQGTVTTSGGTLTPEQQNAALVKKLATAKTDDMASLLGSALYGEEDDGLVLRG